MDIITALACLDGVLERAFPKPDSSRRDRLLRLYFAKTDQAGHFAQQINSTFGGLRVPLPPVTLGKIPTRFTEVRDAILAVEAAAATPKLKEEFGRFLARKWLEGEPRWDDGSEGFNYVNEYGQESLEPEIQLLLRPYESAWLAPLYEAADALAGKPRVRFEEGGVRVAGCRCQWWKLPLPGPPMALTPRPDYSEIVCTCQIVPPARSHRPSV